MVTSATLPVVSEERASEVVRSPGVSSTCEGAKRVCVAAKATLPRELEDDGMVQPRPSAEVLPYVLLFAAYCTSGASSML